MFTKIECGGCGGHFRPTLTVGRLRCASCSHEAMGSDFLPNMDEGEYLTIRGGVLGYTTQDVS